MVKQTTGYKMHFFLFFKENFYNDEGYGKLVQMCGLAKALAASTKGHISPFEQAQEIKVLRRGLGECMVHTVYPDTCMVHTVSPDTSNASMFY